MSPEGRHGSEAAGYSQNKSPNPPASALFSCRDKIVHSHSGYSSSGSATGSCAFLRKLSPLSGVPAGTLLLTRGAAFFCAACAAAFAMAGSGDGVSGALKGCAADVEVAAGASLGRAFVCVAVFAEIGVAFARGDDVERKRESVAVGRDGRAAARRHVRQIILGVRVGIDGGVVDGRCLNMGVGFGEKPAEFLRFRTR
jgi:hypothetical protein